MQSQTLPDLLTDNLDVVFVGSAVSVLSARNGHYYSNPRNAFWKLLNDAGFTPHRLRPDQDAEVLGYGIGISDLVKHVAQSNDDGLDFSNTGEVLAHVANHSPRWIAFNGMGVGKQAAKRYDVAVPSYGRQRWTIGGSNAFVLPSSSSANAKPVIDGKTKLEWWCELQQLTSAP